MTGFDTAAIEALLDQINSSCTSAAGKIVTRIQEGVITPISTCWYTPEGVDFFKSFQSTVAGTASQIQEAFDSFRASVQSAFDNWALNTAMEGGETAQIKLSETAIASIEEPTMTLNVESILPSNGTQVGIDGTAATNVANSLETVQANILEDLNNIAGELDASSAFLGGNQASSIQNCFVKVNQAVANIFKFLTDGDDGLAAQINKAVKKYGSVATDVSSAFSGTN